MIDFKKKNIINLIFILLGGAGLIRLLLQDDFLFNYIHPVSILSAIFFIIGILRIFFQIFINGFRTILLEFILIVFFLILFVGIDIKENEFFKSDKILEAKLIDDLSGINLILRKDGTFETLTYTIYGSDIIKGEYNLSGDTIVFLDYPYDNDFIPLQFLIDYEKQRIWIKRNTNGEFDTKEYFAGYFEIIFNEIE